MERRILAVLFLLAIVGYGFFYFVVKGGKGSTEAAPEQPMQVTGSYDAFSSATTACIDAYYKLTAQLAKDDSSQVDELANAFIQTVRQLPVAQLKADSSLVKLTAVFQQNMANAAETMRNGRNLAEQRKQLQIISDQLFDMLRTTQYKGAKVYQQFCPMAFDNAGANWLSANPAISNPYMGISMPTCGSVIDSIHFKP